jgi:hypothetical protein
MPSVVPAITCASAGNFRREHHGGDLRLVAHLGEEERDERDAEHAERAELALALLVERVGLERPQRHREERRRRAATFSTSGGTAARTRPPAHAAIAWLTSVATTMPARIGQGAR